MSMARSTKINTRRVTLKEIAEAFQFFLPKYFKDVKVNLIDCPDLKSPPFTLSVTGLGGKNFVCDIGSFSYLFPRANTEKRYTFTEIVKYSELLNGEIIGAGAGPFFTVGRNCEMVARVGFKDGVITKNDSLNGVYSESTSKSEVVPAPDNSFALLGHFLVTEGEPGQVIEVDLRGRLMEGAAYVFLREALSARFGQTGDPVALGGVFLLENSKGRFHVLPPFPEEPLDSPAKIGGWLKFFEMEPPIVGLGTLVSHDPNGMDLKLEHFHCYNSNGTQAGHFHFDTNGPDAHYKFYLTPAEQILRIDPKA